MKKTLIYSLTTGLLLCLSVSVAVTPGQNHRPQVNPARVALGAEPHPNIARAIHALEAARGDLQDAAHDYCDHRVAALEATNAGLNQLGAAIACQERRGASSEAPVPPAPASSSATSAGERHPLIRAAINALQSARRDLQNAAHDYCGHRVEALEATNAALSQLQLALRCDRR